MAPPATREHAEPWRVHPALDRMAAYCWRILVVLAVLVPVGWLVDRLWTVIFPVGLAALLTVVLAAPARGMRRRGLPPLVAAWVVVFGFVGVLTLAGFAVVPAVVDEFSDLGTTVGEGLDDLQQWVDEERPFGLRGDQVASVRADAGDAAFDWARSSRGLLVRRAVAALEILAGIVVSVVITFFFVKDGEHFQQAVLRVIPNERRELVTRAGAAAWRTLGGYLRGSALLGIVEGTIMAVAMAVAGASLVVPVAIMTFLAAFVPFAGAIAAGVLATLVTLVTAGQAEAGAILVVAVIVQQFDNDVLAPWVFGRALALHPLVVILSIGAGGALVGPIGAVVAVPLVAVGAAVLAELRVDSVDGPDGAVVPDPGPAS